MCNPIRTRIGVAVGHVSASRSRWAPRAAATAAEAPANAAAMPSPMLENTVPAMLAPSAERSSSSWRDKAARIAASSCCHSRVEPSMSVKRNVTVADGRATPASSHGDYLTAR